MSPRPAVRRNPLLGLVGRAARLLFRALVPGLVAVLIAFARALGGPRYEPPHLPQNQPTEVEKKR